MPRKAVEEGERKCELKGHFERREEVPRKLLVPDPVAGAAF